MLTPTQEDYIEIIFRLMREKSQAGIRVSDIAGELGTKLPTVTRTVQKLSEIGLVNHPHRGKVSLTADGEQMAEEIVHRHADLVRFLTDVLGLDREAAESDVNQIEHGMSSETAQRLHEFLEYLDTLSDEDREVLKRFKASASETDDFGNLPNGKAGGWRT